jgi:hypothetical protein
MRQWNCISSGLLAGYQTEEQHGENLPLVPLSGRKTSPTEQDNSTLPLQTT